MSSAGLEVFAGFAGSLCSNPAISDRNPFGCEVLAGFGDSLTTVSSLVAERLFGLEFSPRPPFVKFVGLMFDFSPCVSSSEL